MRMNPVTKILLMKVLKNQYVIFTAYAGSDVVQTWFYSGNPELKCFWGVSNWKKVSKFIEFSEALQLCRNGQSLVKLSTKLSCLSK